MKRKGVLWLLLAVLWVFSGAGAAVAADPFAGTLKDEEVVLQQALEAYRGGNLAGAEQLLQLFIRDEGASPHLPQAYLHLARIALDRNQPAQALSMLERIPPVRRDQRERVLRGAAMIAAGETGPGAALLNEVDSARLGGSENLLRLTGLARAAQAEGEQLKALLFAHEGVLLAGREASVLISLAHQVLETLPDGALKEALFMFESSSVGADARLQSARRTLAAGDRSAALQQVESLVRSTDASFAYRSEAIAFFEQLRAGAKSRRALGVILPLSGRYAGFGEQIRRGMDLALEVHNRSRPAVEFLFRDDAGEAEKSAAHVTGLVHEEGVLGIAGPLSGPAAEAAAERAQREGVPLLALSQKSGLTGAGSYVFRNSLTTALQVRALARHAVEDLGLKRFGILAPENRMGEEFSSLFSQEVARLGAEVRKRQSYAPGATDFGRQIRVLQGLSPEAPKGEHKSKELVSEQVRPPLAFEALFIPDHADKIAMIAPQLPYYGIRDVQLLGINGWNSPDLVRQAGDSLEGAVFVDGFFLHSPRPFVKDFVRLYLEKHGKDPTILEAQGFDAAGILLMLLDKPQVRSREDLRSELGRLRDYPGATGTTGFGEGGEAEKVLFLLQVKKGNIEQIN